MFNLVGDAISVMLSSAQRNGHLTGLVPHLIFEGITHLQYTDDTIFFWNQQTMTLDTSREQNFHPMLKWALVPAFFAPGTRETFSPGWYLQPGLKVPAQRLLRSAQWQRTFSPGSRHQPGLKVDLYSRLEPPTGTKSPQPLVPVGNTNQD